MSTADVATRTDRRSPRPWLVLVGLLAATAVVAALGAWANAGETTGWYQDAEKPPWNPPSWVFGPVWTVLYVAMAVAAWLVWRRGGGLGLWWTQLAFNLAWSPVFFALQWLWPGLVVILVLDVLVALCVWRFRRSSVAAAWLMVPYLAWTLYATTLNAAIAVLN
ncbi:TspO/MBR family protein [Aeromicrobium sp. IC_218]|uniref:TspO/MBR family protein n=1 Tax=Aeromicrobium sp. IC_218 TaxID=2545468 RepID=UPI00103EAFDC|nr:TspO/MBR family protein [Aeromicrobium sp. IC_218]TCI98756.1 tryptophan-rich sensory protein [Aeromicrobium sp. IC_218]